MKLCLDHAYDDSYSTGSTKKKNPQMIPASVEDDNRQVLSFVDDDIIKKAFTKHSDSKP